MDKVCVITGASRGIGKALAEKFKKEGFLVVNISRSNSSVADININADLSNQDSVSKGLGMLLTKIDKVDVLINNAGIGLYESWENTNIEDIRKVFEVNFFAPIMLTKTLLPLLKQSKGTIINVSSVAGKMYVPYMGGYCSTKFALNAFSDSLRAEIKKYNINVLNLIVGRIDTGFSKSALGSKKPPDTPSLGSSAEQLAEKTFRAYKNKKREIIYPFWYKFLILASKLLPNFYDSKSLQIWERK